ncbi:hypothetical protein BIU98_00445 [Curtobacterium sp. MMLR14_010]|uniref:DUF4232 domain-containing protein n=1 Tax=Curtobacterium sp. MMLR14_010 TaxID=1898743 RepID=UPI0008DDCC42|nr:DUF4232 domain-containing protein [Curtobacterium sp. MMLR14_010]OII36120.1 hypothetical protein BIU98_00445 [Curtobacterium sp. MMLR14_010]
MSPRSCWPLAPIVVALGVLLAGCSSTSTPAPTSTRTVTATATATRSAAATPTSSAVAPSSGSTGTGAEGAAPNQNAAACTTAHLSGAFAGATAGASNVEEELQLTNTGSTDCTLQGWPGVSLVGKGNGTQIGAAADLDRTTPHATVALKPGTTAVARFHIVQADAFDASACKPATGDGFRVYPPGSKTSIFIAASGVRNCTVGHENVFTVGAFH